MSNLPEIDPTSVAAIPVYRQSARMVTTALRVLPAQGLSSREVARRLQQNGPNIVPSTGQQSLFRLFFARFRELLVLFLIAAAVISWLLGERTDALIIAAVIAMDVLLSFTQVWRTQYTLTKLRQQVSSLAAVIRDGKLHRVPTSYLVPGDIIEFRDGEKIPADARLLRVNGLRVAEAALTGESHDVEKRTTRLVSRTPLGNRYNMVYLGTVVVNGSGQAVVTATGTRTEFGRIAQMLKSQPSPSSPLRRKLEHSGLVIVWIIIALVGFSTLLGLALGQAGQHILHTAITLIVSAIPEDLTLILTIALTVGVSRILRQRGVVQELSAAETLGAATVICTDKTGTLTVGEMQAHHFDCLQGTIVDSTHLPHDPWHALALTGYALAADAHRISPTVAQYVGSATERTAVAFVENLGFLQQKLRQSWRLRDSISFNPQWKYRATLHDHPTNESRVIFVSGAPEVLLERSSHCLNTDHEPVLLTAARRAKLHQKMERYAARGERLLAMAVRPHYERADLTHDDVAGLTFLGVLIISDPLRPEIRESIHQTQSAGVSVKIITGDYEATARAIARDSGLTVTDEAVCSGEMLQDLSDGELRKIIDQTVIFSRVNPLDKQRIIRALQDRGHIVAMTGDGVNDAVALKVADIGVAMGSGKDIAKDAADLVLLDDNFATIVHAIREGRVIRDNIRKVIAFLLATNVAEVAVFLGSILVQWPLPLLPAQILWINLVTNGTSDMALALEPDERNVMRRSPENPQASLLTTTVGLHIFITGLVFTTFALGLYWYLWHHLTLDLPYTQTMLFTFLAVSSLLSTWSFRSLTDSLYRRGLFQNPWIIVSAGFSFFLQLLAIYLPALQKIFKTVPLDPYDWIIIITLSVTAVVLLDLRKAVIPHLTTHGRAET
ncbi:MAG: HAD-IC family P-type ATPase [Candidatus Andersenbacteria bacterium]